MAQFLVIGVIETNSIIHKTRYTMGRESDAGGHWAVAVLWVGGSCCAHISPFWHYGPTDLRNGGHTLLSNRPIEGLNVGVFDQYIIPELNSGKKIPSFASLTAANSSILAARFALRLDEFVPTSASSSSKRSSSTAATSTSPITAVPMAEELVKTVLEITKSGMSGVR